MGREFASAAGRWRHLLNAPAEPEITAVCDANPSALEWFKENLPTLRLATTDAAELLASPDVDAVYCAVPHNLHEQMYLDTLKAGKHLFAEKPFGIDLPSCERIVDACHAHPNLLVRCSSEFPFFPAAQRIVKMAIDGEFGQIIEVRAGLLHSSDLDRNKPINWKRKVAMCGEYGCMGDLGMHILHIPLRVGWRPANVRALLSKIVKERPNGKGGMAPCETWDNAILACESEAGFPMLFETKRISPGDTNTWYIRVLGMDNSAEFTTRRPKTIRTMPYHSGQAQSWHEEDLGYQVLYPTITGHIFEFGFTDAILQMWAAFLAELAGAKPTFPCVTPEEALASHRLFTAALDSQREGATVRVGG